jgi:hypothetical protein
MPHYDDSVFINAPFDKKYARLSDAIIFAIHDCGFVARSALEIHDSGDARGDKIMDLIEHSKFGIHDISRAGVDRNTKLARFNMPLELGSFSAQSAMAPTATDRNDVSFSIVTGTAIEASAPT